MSDPFIRVQPGSGSGREYHSFSGPGSERRNHSFDCNVYIHGTRSVQIDDVLPHMGIGGGLFRLRPLCKVGFPFTLVFI